MHFTDSDIWRQLFVLPLTSPHIEGWALVIRAILRVLMGALGVLIFVPGIIWGERRLLGLLQGRLGPNRVGFQGTLQPIADVLKLIFKEEIIPTNVDRTLYAIAPIVAFAPVLMSTMVLPWSGSPDWGIAAPGLNVGILALLAIGSLEVYGTIMAGWSSNNKYSLLGGLRASSQVISYELGMGLSIIAVALMIGTLDTQALVQGTSLNADRFFTDGQGLIGATPIAGTQYTVFEHSWKSGFWDWNVFRLFPFGFIAFGIYLISMVAETNRAPFDLPEAETELVAGFHTEYSSMKFAMFFMGEYTNMLIVSAIAVTLFLGGWLAPWGVLSQIPASAHETLNLSAGIINLVNNAILGPFWLGIKVFFLICFFILLRASLPRLRYDMLMKFGWKGLLPTALVNISLIALDLALQDSYGFWIGHLATLVVAAVIGLGLLMGKKAQYAAVLKSGKTTALVPSDLIATRGIGAPILRPTTVTPTASAPAPEVV